ncbi:hypothetical protein NDU88_006319 [Pleurodeles waltl]|uniref:Uncharacterized protein n=1 Tax=Pleurodeles waltl TaxID=8319 RepID=A0AAV7LS81_PLEWA|nr:hypothetical protein NDU88_006319 [Pleurodeles waltl]
MSHSRWTTTQAGGLRTTKESVHRVFTQQFDGKDISEISERQSSSGSIAEASWEEQLHAREERPGQWRPGHQFPGEDIRRQDQEHEYYEMKERKETRKY